MITAVNAILNSFPGSIIIGSFVKRFPGDKVTNVLVNSVFFFEEAW